MKCHLERISEGILSKIEEKMIEEHEGYYALQQSELLNGEPWKPGYSSSSEKGCFQWETSNGNILKGDYGKNMVFFEGTRSSLGYLVRFIPEDECLEEWVITHSSRPDIPALKAAGIKFSVVLNGIDCQYHLEAPRKGELPLFKKGVFGSPDFPGLGICFPFTWEDVKHLPHIDGEDVKVLIYGDETTMIKVFEIE